MTANEEAEIGRTMSEETSLDEDPDALAEEPGTMDESGAYGGAGYRPEDDAARDTMLDRDVRGGGDAPTD